MYARIRKRLAGAKDESEVRKVQESAPKVSHTDWLEFPGRP